MENFINFYGTFPKIFLRSHLSLLTSSLPLTIKKLSNSKVIINLGIRSGGFLNFSKKNSYALPLSNKNLSKNIPREGKQTETIEIFARVETREDEIKF